MCKVHNLKSVLLFFKGLVARVSTCSLSKSTKKDGSDAPCTIDASVSKCADGSYVITHTICLHVNSLEGFKELTEADDDK